LKPNDVWDIVGEGAWERVRVGGICFRIYPLDHNPRHVHAEYAGIEAIVDLRADGTVALAGRVARLWPANAKRSDVKKILTAAQEHFDLLVAMWEEMHP
jgi:hypothetical protein